MQYVISTFTCTSAFTTGSILINSYTLVWVLVSIFWSFWTHLHPLPTRPGDPDESDQTSACIQMTCKLLFYLGSPFLRNSRGSFCCTWYHGCSLLSLQFDAQMHGMLWPEIILRISLQTPFREHHLDQPPIRGKIAFNDLIQANLTKRIVSQRDNLVGAFRHQEVWS